MKKLLIGMLLITPTADPRRDCAYIDNKDATVLFFFVNSYAMAAEYAKVLSGIGCDTIELCPGFGHEGVAEVKRAVGNKTPVGVVRFDAFPPFGTQSADAFQN